MIDTSQWFIVQDGGQRGPYTAAQVRQLAASGQLRVTDLVWKNGMGAWAPASTVPGLFPVGVIAASGSGGAESHALPAAIPLGPPAPREGTPRQFLGFPRADAPLTAGEPPQYRLFNVWSTLLAGWIGTPLTGCLAIALNFSRLGYPDAARTIGLIGLGWYVVLALIHFFVGGVLETIAFLASLAAMFALARSLVSPWWERHRQAGGKGASETVLVVGCVLALMPFFLAGLLSGIGRTNTPASAQRTTPSESQGPSALKNVEFAYLSKAYKLEDATYDASSGVFSWKLKSRDAKPADDFYAGVWKTQLSQAVVQHSLHHTVPDGLPLQLWSRGKKIGSVRTPVEDLGIGKDGYGRVVVRAEISREQMNQVDKAGYVADE